MAAGLTWVKSNYSGTSGGDCAEAAASHEAVHVRDSKVTGGGPVLRVSRCGRAAFMPLARR
ncbi:hypothetical protein ADK82_28465 [Streptomyces sp. NRRL S-4]|nr:DUF397 domain-containing protein [Streptomyces sp. NRRL S-4]KPC78931.1 hypothetical protein ADK82_28465 [Streptomyces sp. NRRL S-4]